MAWSIVLRELGVGLAEIAEAIDSEPSTVAALRRHHARLLAERERLGEVPRELREDHRGSGRVPA